jgi:hypothetical protein
MGWALTSERGYTMIYTNDRAGNLTSFSLPNARVVQHTQDILWTIGGPLPDATPSHWD